MRSDGDEQRISFRPLADTDIAQMAVWLADPDVYAWYREGEPTVENLRNRYRPIIENTVAVKGWIIEIDRLDAGYVQCSEVDPDSDYAQTIDLPNPYRIGAVGIDVLLGEPAFRNGGWGPIVLRSMLRMLVFGREAAQVALIAPELMNDRAIHAYERAGFRWLKTVPIEDADPDNTEDEYVTVITDEYVMGLTRADFEDGFGPIPGPEMPENPPVL